MFAFFIESFLLGLRNLRLHKLRSLLTALGHHLRRGGRHHHGCHRRGHQESRPGADPAARRKNILVRSTRPPESDEATGKTTRVLEYGLKRADLARLRDAPRLELHRAAADTEQKVDPRRRSRHANAIGTTPEIFSVINLPLARGRYFNTVDYDTQLAGLRHRPRGRQQALSVSAIRWARRSRSAPAG